MGASLMMGACQFQLHDKVNGGFKDKLEREDRKEIGIHFII